MKSTALLPGIFAALATAQYFPDAPIQSDPFYLQVQSNDSALNGRFISPYHTGAALQTLALGSTTKSGRDVYFLNQTEYQRDTGYLTWNLQTGNNGVVDRNFSFALELEFWNTGSNVAPTSIGVTLYWQEVGFDNDKLILPNQWDDSKFVEGERPNVTTPDNQKLSHWHACWSLFNGVYYYQALMWVTSGVPHNPTCRPVDIIKVAWP
ncbi:hypothetical protein V8F20_008483 [Naviculisporaceae sp. PSN 640]